VNFPLIDWGRRRATVKVRREDAEQAYVRYQATVLGALRDVEDALSQISAEQRRRAALVRAVNDADISARATSAQFQTGFVAQNEVLDAQVQVLNAREQLSASDAQLRQSTAALFKALGGGWTAERLRVAEEKAPR
jgi:outer membrane protein TolC